MIEERARVVSLTHSGKDIHLLKLFAPKVTGEARPGQFVMVHVGANKEYVLRRPFSIHRCLHTEFEILFRVSGKGTLDMTHLRPHDELDVIGPLGRGFTPVEDAKRIALVAGGMGIAPLVFLLEDGLPSGAKVHVAVGARTASEMGDYRALKLGSTKFIATTDDGSFGTRGRVTDVLNELILLRPDVMYACGPVAMLKKVAEACVAARVPCQVTLEAMMGCGVGACLGCAVRTTGGYKRVCADGPVFDASEVIWP